VRCTMHVAVRIIGCQQPDTVLIRADGRQCSSRFRVLVEIENTHEWNYLAFRRAQIHSIHLELGFSPGSLH